MADHQYYQHHTHYRLDHVQLPASHSTSDFSHHYSPFASEQDLDSKDNGAPYSTKTQPFEMSTVTPPQRPVYPMHHKDVSYVSDLSEHTDTRSIATSRYPQFNALPQPESSQLDSPRGFWAKILPNSMACRLYLLTVLVETIVDIAIEVDLLVLVKNSSTFTESVDLEVQRLPVYLAVFGLAHLFQLVLALDAVHAQNTLQFMFLIAFNMLLLAYSVVQRTEITGSLGSEVPGMASIPVAALTAIIVAVIALSQIAYIALGYKIYTEFGWKVYKLLGADRSVKRMFMHFQVFLCLIKFDVFFFVGFGVQWISLVLNQANFEYYITIAALPFSVVVLVIGHAAAHRENKWLMAAFITGSTAACVYFVYKFWTILKFRNNPDLAPVFKSLMVFSVLAIVLLVTTFAWAVIVMHNFGHGLKGRVSKHKQGASAAFSTRVGRGRHLSQFEMGTHPHRLSIE